MKKTFTFAVMAVLMACYCHAAIYMVGNDPFGNWNPAAGVEMTDCGDGTYTHSAAINGTVWFVFADGLDSDWTTFNNDFRYGPSNGDQTVTVGSWISTQKAGDHGAYQFTGSGETYSFTFDNNYKRFKVEGYVAPTLDEYTVAGAPVEVFGSEWDINNPDNLMTLGDDGRYYWTKTGVSLTAGYVIEFKVVRNHDWTGSWPDSNYFWHADGAGIYDLTITFDPVSHEIQFTPTLVEEVKPAVPGDLNGDGEVTVADVNLLIDAILTSKLTDEYDFNGDGETNVADVSALINLLLSGNKNDKELTGEIVIAPDENCVHVYYTGDERVTLSVLLDGAAMPLQDGCFYLDEYGEYTIEAIAKARGYKDLKTTLVYVWEDDPEPEVTETPVILVDEHDDCVVVTAVGKGDVYLYIDGELMENPCTITRTSESITIVIVATAQEPGKLISQEAVRYYEIAPIADQPDPKEQGVWVVVLDKDDKEVWFEMHEDDNGYFSAMMPLYSDIYGFETPTGELVARYHFMIDGVLYGAGWDMEPGVGATTWSGYVEAKYLVEWSDYNFSLRTGFNYVLSVYKTDLLCAVSTGGWCGKQ